MPCLRMSVNRLREGMMIKEDVFSKTGAVIVPDGAVVTKDVVALLTRHFVDSVMVEYPTGRKERPEQQEQSAPAKEQHLKEFQAEFSVAEQSISEELKDIVYRSKDVNISMLLEPLNGLLKKADDDTDLADMLLHMKKQQSGLYAHTINVALFGQLLARWSGYSTGGVRNPQTILGLLCVPLRGTTEQNITARSRCLNWHLPCFQ